MRARDATVEAHRCSKWSPQQTALLAGVAGGLTIVFIAGLFVDYLKAEVQIWLFALLASLSVVSSQTPVGANRKGVKQPAGLEKKQ